MKLLHGMTWDHSRGFDPMAATAAQYALVHPGVEIVWERRSLQAFADFPLEQLAAEYDLIVIDHPHVGLAARAGCLVPLDQAGRAAEMADLARQSLGGSHESYQYEGHQWALAIDAATQVASYRPDLLKHIPSSWSEVCEIARTGKVLWPIKPVDALMSFFTLSANRGTPCRNEDGKPLFARDDALVTLQAMLELARAVPAECAAMNPIEAYERMLESDEFVYCPLGYGYTNYAREGYRKNLLRFANIPSLGNNGPVGSCIGGTGIAVSSRCKAIEIAVDYAFWIASANCQKTLFFDSGGQPANAVAWDDAHCNRAAHGFFQDTRAALDAVYLRPRYDGYLEFQDRGGQIVNRFLAGKTDAAKTVDALEIAYRKSLR